MVSLIQSNFASFGSGIVAEGTGFPLQNRGALFTLDRRIRTCSRRASGRCTRSSRRSCAQRLRRAVAFGIMGGWNQSQAHAQFVSNVVDHGMNIQAALEAPRFTKLSFEGNDVAVERRIPERCRRELAAQRPRARGARGLLQPDGRRAGRDAQRMA